MNLHSDQDEGYSSFVVVDEFLHNMAESDLFYEAQSLPFPVEIQMKVQVESKSLTKTALNIKKQQLKEEQWEQHSTGDRSDVSATMVRHLQDEIKREDVFLMNWLAVIVVHGDTKKECIRKATIVRRHLKGAGIICRLPVADQLKLFYKMLPGEKLIRIGFKKQPKMGWLNVYSPLILMSVLKSVSFLAGVTVLQNIPI